MCKSDCKLTVERLRQVLRYDKDTGDFVWIHRDSSKNKIGKIATTKLAYHYLGICIDGKRYFAHRLALFYTSGCWPGIVDHINGIKTDNRLSNLRVADSKVNTQNLQNARKNNKSGLLGVYVFNGKYKSCIRVNKRSLHLGTFLTKEDAYDAYLQAKRKYHVGCTI